MWRSWMVTVMLLGCDDGSRSRLDGVEPGASDRGLADGGSADGGSADGGAADRGLSDTGPLDATPDGATRADMAPPVNCRFEVEIIPTAHRPEHEPIVDGDTVYFTEAGPEGFDRTVRARDRAPVGGPSDRLVAARDGAFLLARQDGDGGRRLIYRDGGGDVPLAERFDWTWSGEIAWRPPQWVEPGRAIWIADGDLFRWQGGAVERIDEGVLDAALDDGRLAWVRRGPAAEGDAFELWMDGAKRLERPGRFLPGGLWASGDRVWVGDHRRVTAVAWGDAPELGCGGGVGSALVGFDAVGDLAIVLAREGEGGAVAAFVCGARSYRVGWTGVAAARWLAGEVVFTEWDDPQAWCQPQTEGRIGWPGPARLTEFALAPIGAGCLCCGAYWPPLTFEAGRGTLAWNYAVTEDGGPGIGIARRICD